MKQFNHYKTTRRVGGNIWICWEWTLMSLQERFKWTIAHGNWTKFKLKFTALFRKKKQWGRGFQRTSKSPSLKLAARKWKNFSQKSTPPYRRTSSVWLARRQNQNHNFCSTHSQWWSKNSKRIHSKLKSWLTLRITLQLFPHKWKEWRERWLKYSMFIKFWKSSSKKYQRIKWTRNG